MIDQLCITCLFWDCDTKSVASPESRGEGIGKPSKEEEFMLLEGEKCAGQTSLLLENS